MANESEALKTEIKPAQARELTPWEKLERQAREIRDAGVQRGIAEAANGIASIDMDWIAKGKTGSNPLLKDLPHPSLFHIVLSTRVRRIKYGEEKNRREFLAVIDGRDVFVDSPDLKQFCAAVENRPEFMQFRDEIIEAGFKDAAVHILPRSFGRVQEGWFAVGGWRPEATVKHMFNPFGVMLTVSKREITRTYEDLFLKEKIEYRYDGNIEIDNQDRFSSAHLANKTGYFIDPADIAKPASTRRAPRGSLRGPQYG